MERIIAVGPAPVRPRAGSHQEGRRRLGLPHKHVCFGVGSLREGRSVQGNKRPGLKGNLVVED